MWHVPPVGPQDTDPAEQAWSWQGEYAQDYRVDIWMNRQVRAKLGDNT